MYTDASNLNGPLDYKLLCFQFFLSDSARNKYSRQICFNILPLSYLWAKHKNFFNIILYFSKNSFELLLHVMFLSLFTDSLYCILIVHFITNRNFNGGKSKICFTQYSFIIVNMVLPYRWRSIWLDLIIYFYLSECRLQLQLQNLQKQNCRNCKSRPIRSPMKWVLSNLFHHSFTNQKRKAWNT